MPGSSGRPSGESSGKSGDEREGNPADFPRRGEANFLGAAKSALEQSLGLDGTESWSGHAFGGERDRQVASLERWATEQHLWLPPHLFAARNRGRREHDVLRFGEPTARIVKVTKGGIFGAYPWFDDQVVSGMAADCFGLRPGTPHQYLTRMELVNEALFPELNRLEGFTRLEGHFVIVTSQPLFTEDSMKAPIHNPSENGIRRFFGNRGFLPVDRLGYDMWFSPEQNLALFDVGETNLLRWAEDSLIPIDVIPIHPAGLFQKRLIEVVSKV
jgi:hypothetical protein